MPAAPQRAILRSLGVNATDAQGNVYRVVVGERSEGAYATGYALWAARAVPDGTLLTIPGLTGEWRVSQGDDRKPDGYWHGSIS